MLIHTVKSEKKSGDLVKFRQLAWKIAEVATKAEVVPLDPDVVEMVKCRLIDNAAIALGAINQDAVVTAREDAQYGDVSDQGATIYGLGPDEIHSFERAAFANAVAVRFLDQDDTYLAAEYSHPDDNISPILAVAQKMGIGGDRLIRGIAVAYEIQVALVGTGNGTGICLHEHKVDHMTHIAAGTAAGICSMLGLSQEQTYHAINFAVHNAISSRQSRKGDIGSQKEFVPGISAKIAIDAVSWAMQGRKGPNPVYEGVDSIMARFLDGPDAEYKVELPAPGVDPLRNIMITYPKEHAFEYQGQAIIDAALEVREQLPKRNDGSIDVDAITEIVLETSHHTHHVIGTDANDPQKSDIHAPRGTLDHSIMFAIARAIQTGEWHHERTYDIESMSAEDQADLQALVNKVRTVFDQKWEEAYHSTDPKVQAFGGKMLIELTDGSIIEKEKARANAHVYGDTPWDRDQYIGKFDRLTDNVVSDDVRDAFLALIDHLDQAKPHELRGLTPEADMIELAESPQPGLYSNHTNG